MNYPRHIRTNYNPKPGPDFRFDWEAVWDNYDGDSHIGLGATEQEAIEDLRRLDEEAAELEAERNANHPFSGSF